ncbi:hypothetical protein V492_08022, partial [Pseudogymnoascus sp. VKM F-4246]
PPADPPVPIVPDHDDKGRPLSAGARERRLSEQQLVKMERGLSHGLESIRDAKRGIEKLEQVVSSAPPAVATKEVVARVPPHYPASAAVVPGSLAGARGEIDMVWITGVGGDDAVYSGVCGVCVDWKADVCFGVGL